MTVALATLVTALPGSLVAAEPVITTVAGGCVNTGECVGGNATGLFLQARGLATDASGHLYIAVGQVYKVAPGGSYTIIAGGDAPSSVYNGDGIPATSAGVDASALAFDHHGNLYVADQANARIRRIAPNGIISTVAGNGTAGFAGDGGLATSARINQPTGVAVDGTGALYILDRGNHRIRKVDNGIITTIAGTGVPGHSGDNGLARLAQLNDPRGIAADAAGHVYVADTGNARVRRIGRDGVIRTIAGGGPFLVDPLATRMSLSAPQAITVDPVGNVLFATPSNVHRIEPDGVRRTVVGAFDEIQGLYSPEGPGIEDEYGDGGAASLASVDTVRALAFDASGNLFLADEARGRVRKVTPIPWYPRTLGLDSLATPQLLPLVGWFSDATVADMNGDGRGDIVLATRVGRFSYNPATDLKLHILLQRASGGFEAPRTLDYGYAHASTATWVGGKLVVADFNRDGVSDVAVSRSGGVALVAGSRSGQFQVAPLVDLPSADPVFDLTVFDANADGNPDLLTYFSTGSLGTPRFIRSMGNGRGGIASSAYLTPGHAADNLVSGDFNGDGLVDVAYAYATPDGGDGGVALVSAVGRSAPTITLLQIDTWRAPMALTAGDVDGDGHTDLVFELPPAQQDPAHLARVAWLRQDGNGQLGMQAPIGVYSTPDFLALKDIDGDDRADLVTSSGGGVALMRGSSAGFERELKHTVPDLVPEEAPKRAIGDINSDGLPDVLVAAPGVGVQILLGRSAPLQRRRGNTPLSRPPGGLPSSPTVAFLASRPLATQATSPSTHASPRALPYATSWRGMHVTRVTAVSTWRRTAQAAIKRTWLGFVSLQLKLARALHATTATPRVMDHATTRTDVAIASLRMQAPPREPLGADTRQRAASLSHAWTPACTSGR